MLERAKRCPACLAVWRGRSARFCGRCGAVLTPTRPRASTPRRPHRRTSLLTGTAAIGVLVAVLAGVRVWTPDRLPGSAVVEIGAGRTATSEPAPPGSNLPPAAVGGGLIIVLEDDRLLASDAVTGWPRFDVSLTAIGLPVTQQVARSAPGPAPETTTSVSVRAHDGGAIVASGGVTVALDARGGVRWTHRSTRWHTAVTAADDERAVLVGPDDDSGKRLLLEVLETDDGTVRFSRRVATVIGVGKHSAMVEEIGKDGQIAAIDLDDGSLRWRLGSRGPTDRRTAAR
ncbi:hypothetical protein [Egicoccus sp. AB-alg2]|uniref:hypothetical protein n=1 Tax=Egicoccus sp. AB-alg2 TaxID=3242693 RepID=UPI00359DB543